MSHDTFVRASLLVAVFGVALIIAGVRGAGGVLAVSAYGLLAIAAIQWALERLAPVPGASGLLVFSAAVAYLAATGAATGRLALALVLTAVIAAIAAEEAASGRWSG